MRTLVPGVGSVLNSTLGSGPIRKFENINVGVKGNVMLKTEEPRERSVKKPLVCPFMSDAQHKVDCIREKCMLYNRAIKQCALVDLAITMHEVEKHLGRFVYRP